MRAPCKHPCDDANTWYIPRWWWKQAIHTQVIWWKQAIHTQVMMRTRYTYPGDNDDAKALDTGPGRWYTGLTDWLGVVDFGLKVEVFKSVYRKRFNRNKQCCAHVCVMNIILHTLLLVDVCENINTIYIQLYTVKNRINIPQSFFFFYNQNSLFDMLEGTIIDCRLGHWSCSKCNIWWCYP